MHFPRRVIGANQLDRAQVARAYGNRGSRLHRRTTGGGRGAEHCRVCGGLNPRSNPRAAKPATAEAFLEGLGQSVEGFEKSHPRLVQIVNGISNTLSNLGI